MTSSPTSAKKIAKLARIELTDIEADRLQAEFDKILEYIHQIDTVAIPEDTEPFFGATESTNAVRHDEVIASEDRESILKNAPDSDGDFYRVPPVF